VKRPTPNTPQPTKDELLAFIGSQTGKVGTREIARAFGLKSADRVVLKRMLRELADEGHLEQRRKKLHHRGALAADDRRRYHDTGPRRASSSRFLPNGTKMRTAPRQKYV